MNAVRFRYDHDDTLTPLVLYLYPGKHRHGTYHQNEHRSVGVTHLLWCK